MSVKLYRIFTFSTSERREVGRALIRDGDEGEALQWLIKEWVVEEKQGDVEEFDFEFGFGFELFTCDESDVRECQKLYETDDPCTDCMEPPKWGLILEEMEEWDESDLQYKTIYGTNEYYDFTLDPSNPRKAEDWNPLLALAWRRNPQLGISVLVTTTVEENPRLERAFDPEFLKKSREDAEKLRKEVCPREN